MQTFLTSTVLYIFFSLTVYVHLHMQTIGADMCACSTNMDKDMQTHIFSCFLINT